MANEDEIEALRAILRAKDAELEEALLALQAEHEALCEKIEKGPITRELLWESARIHIAVEMTLELCPGGRTLDPHDPVACEAHRVEMGERIRHEWEARCKKYERLLNVSGNAPS